MKHKKQNNENGFKHNGLYPNGVIDSTTEEQVNNKSLRSIERSKEDHDYIPVIIKRNDQSTKHPDDTLEHAIIEGLKQHSKDSFSLFLSSFAAGLTLGISAMCIGLIFQIIPADENIIKQRLFCGLVYPLGFVVCIMSGTTLFTEQTATAFYPVLDGRARFKNLCILWFFVIIGNLIGTFTISFLFYLAEPVISIGPGILNFTSHLVKHSGIELFISSILAGFFMAQGGWLIISTSSSYAQIMYIYIVTFVIGFGGLHHSIAGSAEIFSSFFLSESINIFSDLIFLSKVILGNLLGGTVFVGLLNYGRIRKVIH